MKIDERKALNTQKPQSEKVYETKAEVSSRTAKKSFAAGEDGVDVASAPRLRPASARALTNAVTFLKAAQSSAL